MYVLQYMYILQYMYVLQYMYNFTLELGKDGGEQAPRYGGGQEDHGPPHFFESKYFLNQRKSNLLINTITLGRLAPASQKYQNRK